VFGRSYEYLGGAFRNGRDSSVQPAAIAARFEFYLPKSLPSKAVNCLKIKNVFFGCGLYCLAFIIV